MGPRFRVKWTCAEDHWVRFFKWSCCRSFFPIILRYSYLLLWGCGQRAALSKLLACEKRHIHSLFAECAGDTGPPDRHRRAVCQRLMASALVGEIPAAVVLSRGLPTCLLVEFIRVFDGQTSAGEAASCHLVERMPY